MILTEASLILNSHHITMRIKNNSRNKKCKGKKHKLQALSYLFGQLGRSCWKNSVYLMMLCIVWISLVGYRRYLNQQALSNIMRLSFMN